MFLDKMLSIPYEQQIDEQACALACYTMVARHFFPEITAEDIKEIADWESGYVVWPFKFWLWLLDKGISIEDYDLIDYEAWAREGADGLKKSTPEKEFGYYFKHTKNLDTYGASISALLNHPNFTYHREKPEFQHLEHALHDGKICEVVLNSKALRNKDGFSLHRVIVLDLTDTGAILHDPSHSGGPNLRVSKEKFLRAWLKTTSAPELCTYSKADQ